MIEFPKPRWYKQLQNEKQKKNNIFKIKFVIKQLENITINDQGSNSLKT